MHAPFLLWFQSYFLWNFSLVTSSTTFLILPQTPKNTLSTRVWLIYFLAVYNHDNRRSFFSGRFPDKMPYPDNKLPYLRQINLEHLYFLPVTGSSLLSFGCSRLVQKICHQYFWYTPSKCWTPYSLKTLSSSARNCLTNAICYLNSAGWSKTTLMGNPGSIFCGLSS